VVDDPGTPVELSLCEPELLELPSETVTLCEAVASPLLLALASVLRSSGFELVASPPLVEDDSSRTQRSPRSLPAKVPYLRPLGHVESRNEQNPEDSQKPSEPHWASWAHW
jgi:hypothetical protein